MKDIVERLRKGKSAGGYWREKEAADEIERLREERDKLKEALHSLIALTATALKESK